VRIVLADLMEDARPDVARIREDVRLRDHGQLLLLVSRTRRLEGVPDTTLDTLARADARLERCFVRSAFLEDAAGTRVHAFGVLADDDEVDVVRGLAGDRTRHAGIQTHRTEIDVLIE